jgi:hypothetical protein
MSKNKPDSLSSMQTNLAEEVKDFHVNGADHSAGTSEVVSNDDDIFDPEKLRLRQDFAEDAGVKIILTVKVRRPPKQAFFRVRSDPEYRLPALLLELEEDRETYLVLPKLVFSLASDAYPATLFTCLDTQGNLFLYPVKMPKDGRTNDWCTSSMAAVQLAMTDWVKMRANMKAGFYEVYRAAAHLPEPEWPDITFKEILRLAFRDKYITDLEHPVLKKLRGEIF